jgi:hypothetical protein
MAESNVSDPRWHRSVHYPALSGEAVARLHEKLDTLSAACNALAKSNYEQECHIIELEAHVKHLERLKESYETLIVAKVGYRRPEPPEPEPFSY